MQKPSLGWQSWSPPFPVWHGFPRWDYSPFKSSQLQSTIQNLSNKVSEVRYWCSWYAYGWDINDSKINVTLDVIKKYRIPFTHILIDDGWTTWGDWSTPNQKRFPHFIDTVSKIHKNGLKAGLWFAPFLANKNSQIFKNHPEWFVTYKGKYIQGLKTIPIWEWFLPKQYLLNFELKEVQKYIKDFLDIAINKWEVDLLKLDFLYAPYFNSNLKSDFIPHNQIAWLLEYINKRYPKITTIACGAPFSPSINLASITRVSKDTALPPLAPKIINKIIYHSRVVMLSHKLDHSRELNLINLDPDVRLFSLDNLFTSTFWNSVSKKILGIGDDLTKLSSDQLKSLKIWLS